MKRFKLITTQVTSNSQVPEAFELNYRKEFLRMIEIAPEGTTVSQMGTAIKVAKKLQDTPDDGTVFLEDAEHEYLLGKARAFRFTLIAAEIVEMIEAVEKAETCEAPHLKRENPKARARADEETAATATA